MEKNFNEKKKFISFSLEEEKLLKKYIEEYNELYEKILLLSSKDFFQSLIKRIEITLKEKFNDYSKNSKMKIENFVMDKIYSNDYKYALFAKSNILQRCSSEINYHYFNDEIIPHCENDKKDNYYIHTCGQKFQTFKYKALNDLSTIYKKYKINEKIILLYCEDCDMIYKSDLIKFKCNSSKEDFYSKIIDKNNENNYQLATWKKYHCNIIINDCMKCQICHENLYYLSEINLLFCQKCNLEFNPTTLMWKCIKCKNYFIAEAKIFNPLEYKNMKICVKEAILNKKKAKPKYLECGCEADLKTLIFYHKNSCRGELYFWELNNKKVVICSKCESLGTFDGYVWTCPICNKRFKNKINKEKNENDNKNEENNNNIINKFYNYSNSNWYPKINNNIYYYKSPNKYNNNLLFQNKNDDNEIKYQSDMKNLNLSRRNNSSEKIMKKERCASGIPSQTKYLNNIDDIYALPETNQNNNIKKINIPKSNKSPTKKLESKLLFNHLQKSRNYSNYKENNRLLSNADLSEAKNLENIFNNCFSAYKNNNGINNSNYNFINNENINYLNNEADLYDKIQINNKYKKTIVNSYNKIINRPSSCNNSINNELVRKRSNSNCNSIKINKNEVIPNFINNNQNNIISKQSKIPINKINNNINRINVNGKNFGTISLDTKEKINKKIIPGQLILENYLIKKQIGQGSFGQIFLVENYEHKEYALKKIIANSSNSIKKIKNELQILLNIQNNGQQINAIEIYGMTSTKLDQTTYALYILMELAYTDWEKEILERKKIKNYYTEYELMSILICLVKSLSILQKQNISHRDIKPQNILILKDKNSQKIYKLADFGEAKELLKDERPTNKQTLRGTELFMSPILFYGLRGRKKMKYIKHNPYKSDVFSFGLCALLAATLGFEILYDVRELKSNVSIYVVVEKYLRYRYSDSVINIISKMLDINENTRCDFIELENQFNEIGYY